MLLGYYCITMPANSAVQSPELFGIVLGPEYRNGEKFGSLGEEDRIADDVVRAVDRGHQLRLMIDYDDD